jgi:hypothetical protein
MGETHQRQQHLLVAKNLLTAGNVYYNYEEILSRLDREPTHNRSRKMWEPTRKLKHNSRKALYRCRKVGLGSGIQSFSGKLSSYRRIKIVDYKIYTRYVANQDNPTSETSGSCFQPS